MGQDVMVDSLDIAREWLIATNTTLFTAIGDAGTPDDSRVWLEGLSSDFDNVTDDVLVIELAEETSEPNGAIHDAILVVRCYAASKDVGPQIALYGKVWDRLQKATGTTSAGNIVQATHASALGVVTDKETGRLMHVSRWNLRTEEA